MSHENERRNLLETLNSGLKGDKLEYAIDSILNSGYPVDKPVCSETGQTLLMLIVNSERPDRKVINRILAYNADINKQDNNGRTALHLACRAGSASEAMKPLLSVGE